MCGFFCHFAHGFNKSLVVENVHKLVNCVVAVSQKALSFLNRLDYALFRFHGPSSYHGIVGNDDGIRRCTMRGRSTVMGFGFGGFTGFGGPAAYQRSDAVSPRAPAPPSSEPRPHQYSANGSRTGTR